MSYLGLTIQQQLILITLSLCILHCPVQKEVFLTNAKLSTNLCVQTLSIQRAAWQMLLSRTFVVGSSQDLGPSQLWTFVQVYSVRYDFFFPQRKLVNSHTCCSSEYMLPDRQVGVVAHRVPSWVRLADFPPPAAHQHSESQPAGKRCPAPFQIDFSVLQWQCVVSWFLISRAFPFISGGQPRAMLIFGTLQGLPDQQFRKVPIPSTGISV